MKSVFKSHRSAAVLAIMAATLLASCGGGDDERVASVVTLSNRADMVSGDDVLVEVVLKQGQDSAQVKVTLNGDDVTSAFSKGTDGRFKAMLTGLKRGTNLLAAKYKGGPVKALTITNYPIGGPIFSGSQMQPWICETDTFGLGPSVDAQCNAPSQVAYVYRSKDPAQVSFLPFDPKNRPTDVATVTTDTGVTVPYIVRVETGTANRGIYVIAYIADPAQTASPLNPPASWNGALVYAFRGGALPQHRQGPIDFNKASGYNNPRDTVLQPTAAAALAKGYAVVTNTLNHFAQNTNSVTSAETAIMMKEKVAELLGEIKYTIGIGESGGSIQQNLIVNAYPGIIDGAIPNATFTDVWSTNTEVQDCSLLARYFDANPGMWSNVSLQNAVMSNANLTPGTCRSWISSHRLDTGWMNPASPACFNANPTLSATPNPKEPWEYDPVTNRKGARCTLQDYQANTFGLRDDGFAHRPYDNVGVQYGLAALNAGTITAEQFVDLNERIGGRDIDWNWTESRALATTEALDRVYRSGQYNLMNNAASTPIIDIRSCTNTEIHSCFNTFKLRRRLENSTGQKTSAVLLLNKPALDNIELDIMAAWLRAVKADNRAGSLTEKVARNRPADAVDSCWINGSRVTDTEACAAENPYFGEPRMGAGAPIDAPAAKCQLAPLNRAGYGVTFSDLQWARMQTAFPQGVCDWTKPGAGQSGAVPWLSYVNGPGGEPIPAAPVARDE